MLHSIPGNAAMESMTAGGRLAAHTDILQLAVTQFLWQINENLESHLFQLD